MVLVVGLLVRLPAHLSANRFLLPLHAPPPWRCSCWSGSLRRGLPLELMAGVLCKVLAGGAL